jgi:hypothetical protein
MNSVPSSHYSTSKNILGDAFPKSGILHDFPGDFALYNGLKAPVSVVMSL